MVMEGLLQGNSRQCIWRDNTVSDCRFHCHILRVVLHPIGYEQRSGNDGNIALL